jgi:hypothetical protein
MKDPRRTANKTGIFVLTQAGAFLVIIGLMLFSVPVSCNSGNRSGTTLESAPDSPMPIPSEDELLHDPSLTITIAEKFPPGGSNGIVRIDAEGACNYTYWHEVPGPKQGWKCIKIHFGKEKLQRLAALLTSSGFFGLGKRYVTRGVSNGPVFSVVVRGSKFRKAVTCIYLYDSPRAMSVLKKFIDKEVFAGVDFSRGEWCESGEFWEFPDAP